MSALLRKQLRSVLLQYLPQKSLHKMEHFKDSATNILKANNPEALHVAAACFRNGKVIALPTDTVYGLACDAMNENAIKTLYAIKGREFSKPVAICVKDIATLRMYGQAEHLPDELLHELLPGPITIVIERTKNLSNPFLNPGVSKIGIRIPDFMFIRNLCKSLDNQPVALTSANRSSEPSSLNIAEFRELWKSLGVVIDAGSVGYAEERRAASTVVDLSVAGFYKIVREGVALKETLDILKSYGLQDKNLAMLSIS